jgi:hypothetical protein
MHFVAQLTHNLPFQWPFCGGTAKVCSKAPRASASGRTRTADGAPLNFRRIDAAERADFGSSIR